MRLIAHRGNIRGKSNTCENDPYYVLHAINVGFDAEIDLWCLDGRLMLGHDRPEYDVPDFLFADLADRLWVHAKHYEALRVLSEDLKLPHYFFHDKDAHTLTSCGKIWTYPGAPLGKSSIAVMPETISSRYYEVAIQENAYGICSDDVWGIRETLTVGDLRSGRRTGTD